MLELADSGRARLLTLSANMAANICRRSPARVISAALLLKTVLIPASQNMTIDSRRLTLKTRTTC
jgi:hypothetical protein